MPWLGWDKMARNLTENGRNLFSKLDKEKVTALNKKIVERKWQLPSEKQKFNNGKHRSYTCLWDEENDFFISSNNLSLLNISISFCFKKAFSSDQIGALFNASERAKYCTSFSCGDSFSASEAYELKSLNGTISICDLRKENTSDNSSFVSLLLPIISSKCLPISKNINSGAANWNLLRIELRKNTLNFSPLDNNTEYIILVSTTINISAYPFNDSLNLFANALLVSSENSLISSSVNLDFATIPFMRASFNNSTTANFLNVSESSNCDNDFKSSSNSLGIVNRTSIKNFNEIYYINLSNFSARLTINTNVTANVLEVFQNSQYDDIFLIGKPNNPKEKEIYYSLTTKNRLSSEVEV